LFITILVLRRIPPLLLLYKWIPEISTWREALFSGHFGPMGVGAVFVSTLALTRLPTPQSPPQGQPEHLAATLQTIVSFVVLGSIITHGLSIPFFSLGKNMRTRTVSISRTWTSRGTTAPDWLLGARRLPGTPAQVATRPATPSINDIEQARGGGHVTANITETRIANGPIVSRSVSVHSRTADTTTSKEELSSPQQLLQDVTSSLANGQALHRDGQSTPYESHSEADRLDRSSESGIQIPKSIHFPRDGQETLRVDIASQERYISPMSEPQSPNKSVRFPPEYFDGPRTGEDPGGVTRPPSPSSVQQKMVHFPPVQ